MNAECVRKGGERNKRDISNEVHKLYLGGRMSGKVVEIGSNGIGEESELLKLRISCADAKNLEGPVHLIYHFIGLSFGV